MKKTPIRQREYFEEKVRKLFELYPGAEVISCGYGKSNVDGVRNINELIALANGAFFCTGEDGIVLDIGGAKKILKKPQEIHIEIDDVN